PGLHHFPDYLPYVCHSLCRRQVQLMMKIATENLLTQELCMKEEVYHQSLIKPLHIRISRYVWKLAASQCEAGLGSIPFQLSQFRNHCLHQAFQQAHFIILLDFLNIYFYLYLTRQVRKVSERYQPYGHLNDERAHMNVAVIVAGNSLVNLKCSLLLENAPSVDSGRFMGMATQLEYEAGHTLHRSNISGSSHVDLQRAKVFQYEGTIWGPSDFSQPVLEIIYDRKWLQSDFLNLVSSQRATVASKSQRATAISATNRIIAVLKAWNCNSSAKEVLSFGILSTGQYNLPAGVVFSMPVSLQDGRWSVLSDVIGDEKRATLQIAADQLREEKDLASRTRKDTA
uniref:Malate dehydrogenase 1B, NAD (soluble) n=1 Tax=Oncorhynchus tshawytscha TaxID=74940 RepID=A0A8C8JQN2_ONCTS